MSVGTRLTAFAALLVVLGTAGAALGTVVGPIDTGAPASETRPATVDPYTATIGDVEVTLHADPTTGPTDVYFTLTRDGEPVAPDPYLGGHGHLVAYRISDRTPITALPPSRSDEPLAFSVYFPDSNTYRLLLDVKVDGRLHTVGFTVTVDPPGSSTPSTPLPPNTRAHDGGNHGG